MSAIVNYTVDLLGYIPRLWEIYETEHFGVLRCINCECLKRGAWSITAEILPRGWKVRK